ncbi:MAG TPA: zinc ribbon domain-containing protein, partial [Armatimonadetes bacterium]|nr:zinc ribbon domain-containing protein [Armatimonadota bacterium]
MVVMFCPYCGTKLINDASFCHQCGAPAPSIPEREGALEDEQVGAVSPHVLDELAPQEPSARRISVRLLKRILIIAVAVIIIGAFGVAIYLAIRPTGWRVLRRCAAKYGTAKALRISADINVNFGGFGVAQRIQFKATVARPNLANVESEFSSAGMPPLRQRMISDGANLYIECDGDKDVRSAPKQFTDLPWGRMGALAIWYASARFSAKMLGKNVERFMHPLLESTTKGWFDWSDLFG